MELKGGERGWEREGENEGSVMDMVWSRSKRRDDGEIEGMRYRLFRRGKRSRFTSSVVDRNGIK